MGRTPSSRAILTNMIRSVVIMCLAQFAGVAFAQAAERAPPTTDTLMKVVILSRHGVRSPIPSQSELETWTASPWPVWNCAAPPGVRICGSGELTPKGATLAEQMGTYYRTYLSGLLPPDQCPDARDLFLWADRTQRTERTGLALLRGFRPKCDPATYFHTAPSAPDKIFHPVSNSGRCKIDAARAERDILARAGGSLSRVSTSLADEFATAQKTLQCCQKRLCQATLKACRLPSPVISACSLKDRLPSCLVTHPESGEPKEVLAGGALRVASTFAELLLLEYANGFPASDVGWGRISREQMTPLFRLHTAAFDLEQRTPYVAKRQGSALVKKILLALEDRSDNQPGTAPSGAKFVAYVGHDTNISNVASVLGLSWRQPGYQKDQTPPAGALLFELHRSRSGLRYVSAFYVAQSLDDMRNGTGTSPRRTAVPISGCSNETQCPADQFAKLAEQVLDPNCAE